MALEIERRFFVCGDGWRAHADGGTPLEQGYLSSGGGEAVTLRVRRRRCSVVGMADRQPQRAWLTLKAVAGGIARHEFEYPIPDADAVALLQLCPARVEKVRYHLDLPGGDWVLDRFEGTNGGLLLAEVELAREDAALDLPDWLGAEVTGIGSLSNAALAAQPWMHRSDEQRQRLGAPG
ncbi:MAG: CYTH domain-containing protein [Aphanocapsa feldmannii 277cV]|uniref:CYTH domain-containing protein n=1 Tax=Aphanocapsa feldmannii 277cV TaxID=2507553 RepID=A0A524RKF5_9CHRO|nr:MAG: CYTH domain-containing protein [Aphanocapsa feldmannii 288cV]TGG90109.1 MAG: CYTH domain-containing protein [Aphanocapsa feldmannii 277cV]